MCYSVTLASAFITTVIWQRKKNLKVWWLVLMFYGAALFGVVDHLWNRELLLISKDIVGDLILGVVISASILLLWTIMVVLAKSKEYDPIRHT